MKWGSHFNGRYKQEVDREI